MPQKSSFIHAVVLTTAVLCAAFSPSVRAMELVVMGNTAILSGPVTGREPGLLKQAFAANPHINLVVLRNSHGGNATMPTVMPAPASLEKPVPCVASYRPQNPGGEGGQAGWEVHGRCVLGAFQYQAYALAW